MHGEADTHDQVCKPTFRRSGFTLLELLVVAFVLGILVSLGLFVMNGAADNATTSKAKNNLRSISIMAETLRLDNDGRYGESSDELMAHLSEHAGSRVNVAPLASEIADPNTVLVSRDASNQITLCTMSGSWYCTRSLLGDAPSLVSLLQPSSQPVLVASSNPRGQQSIAICHATGSPSNPYALIVVAAAAVNGHQNHDGDIIPAPVDGCPGPPPAPEDVPAPEETPDPIEDPVDGGSDESPEEIDDPEHDHTPMPEPTSFLAAPTHLYYSRGETLIDALCNLPTVVESDTCATGDDTWS